MRGFRVWSDYWKKYATEAELHMDGSVDAIFEDADGVPHHENADLVLEFDTGLKDENGKEIYEGDIVKYTTCYFGNEKRHRKVVEWEEWDSDDFGEPHNIGYFDLSEYMGVIGNVHENPELLEEEE